MSNCNKKVICVETGEIYDSIVAAAGAIHRAPSSLSIAIKRAQRCAGCHWRFHFDFNENLIYNISVRDKKGGKDK